MEILEGAMAFAVAMIIFSTMATGIVEILLRFTHTKAAFLHQSIEKMLKDLVAAKLSQTDSPAKAALEQVSEDDLTRVANALTVNPARVPGWWEDSLLGKAWFKWTDRAGNRFRIDALSTVAFAKRLSETDLVRDVSRRLAETDLGPASGADVKTVIADLTHDLESLYDRYRATAKERFRKNAQSLTVVISIAMALVFNIHAGRLFLGVMDTEGAELRETLINEADDRHAAYVAAEQKLQATLKALEAAEGDDEATAEVTGALQDQIADLQAVMQKDAATALMPVGMAYYPHCRFSAEHSSGENCPDSFWRLELLGWVFNALLAGVLIGLGGPFWYGVFTSLSQLTQALKAFGVRKGGNPEMLSDSAQNAGVMAKQDATTAGEVTPRATAGASSAAARRVGPTDDASGGVQV